MDKLSDIPVKSDTVHTPEESAVMQQFFDSGGNESEPKKPAESPTLKSKLNWKLIGSTALVFVLLANPWIDQILCKVPYCGDSAATLLGIKILIFLILTVAITLFL